MAQLAELSGTVEYDLAGGGVATATMSSRVRFPRPEDATYPHVYRSAWNGQIFLSFTQAALDEGRVRQLPAGAVFTPYVPA